MATIVNNSNAAIDCRSIVGINNILVCGNNVGFDNRVFSILKEHSTLKTLLENKTLEFKDYEVQVEGYRLGLPIAENKENGEDYPVVDSEFRANLGEELPLAQDGAKQQTKPKKTKLIAIPEQEIKEYSL
jgi:hypothetical protein